MRASASSRHPAVPKAQQNLARNSAAPASEEWRPLFEEGAQPLNARLLALAWVGEGQRVLAAAAGETGEPAYSLARLVGPAGRVVALDRSAGRLAVAREEAVRLGLSNLSFEEQTAGELDFPVQSFDAVLNRWGLVYETDLAKSLRQTSKVLRSGGHFAAAVWSASPKVPLLSLPGAVIAQTLRLPPRPGDPSFNLANRHALAHAFGQAGFVRVRSEILTITVSFSTIESYMRYLQTVSPYLVSLLASLPAEQREFTWQTVGEAARQRYTGPDGTLQIPGETILVAGQKP